MKSNKVFFMLLPLVISSTLFSCSNENKYIKGEYVDLKNLIDNSFTMKEFENSKFTIKDSMLYKDNYPIINDPISSLYLADVNEDGYRDVCATLSIGYGFINEEAYVYDIKNSKSLMKLSNRFDYDYNFVLDDRSQLMVERKKLSDVQLKTNGYLYFSNDEVQVEWNYLTEKVEAGLYLYQNGILEELAYEKEGSKNTYIVNTFCDFAIRLNSSNGHNEEFLINPPENNYHGFMFLEPIVYEDGSIIYPISFSDSKIDKINFKVLDSEFTFNIEISNDNAIWDKYRLKMGDVVTWIKDLNAINTNEIKLEPRPGSIAPGSLFPVYRIKNKEYIQEIVNVKNSYVYSKTSEDDLVTPGTGTTILTFYTNEEEYTLRINNGSFKYGIDSYLLMGEINYSLFYDHGERYNKILTYSDYIEVNGYKNPTKKFYIDFLDEIEFKLWPQNEIYEDIEPTYIITDIRAVSSKILIYSPTRFSINNGQEVKMYQVQGTIDFSSIF